MLTLDHLQDRKHYMLPSNVKQKRQLGAERLKVQ